MIDLYLRFADYQEALSVLSPLGFTYTDEEGTEQFIQGNHKFALWQVGEISGYDGYHINIRQIDPELDLSSLESYRVYPPYPVCVWA